MIYSEKSAPMSGNKCRKRIIPHDEIKSSLIVNAKTIPQASALIVL
ncbi:Uncharacterised protein [Enterobacter cancerogenus]|uniref:Uncharacterized protein n=1 Tax=Enterobacter cancerogenus TaxID=69218 RepID=A0A484YCG6_9ENTR|nr:Uncharacterised protein [Enterobacter cancerogenus]